MGIDLSGRDVGVAKDGLHRPEISAVFNHVGSATVTQGVRAGMASGSRSSFHHHPDTLAA